uniref:NADH-ubiquinone oxidoreductase chain 4L n=1 Tax=Carpelimus fuliginosus TaxID=1587133 RepID=A0A343C169_9COLE|nr:NADH dehydrogenase subunit 4L [Carpelimus fuliginosus]
MLNYIFVLVFISGLLSFCTNKHFLLMLLSLEFVMMGLFLGLFIFVSFLGNSFYFLMIFMIMVVSEGVLGLSILVSMARMFGNDYFLSFNTLW